MDETLKDAEKAQTAWSAGIEMSELTEVEFDEIVRYLDIEVNV